MVEELAKLSGGCLCGAVRFETTGPSFKVLNCHCNSCRKHNGAPVATLAGFRAPQVTFSGEERKVYTSSPGVGRTFCGTCGTPLTWEGDDPDRGPIFEFHISTFDRPEALRPTLHSFDAERIAWFDVADDLPRYAGLSEKSPIVRHGPAEIEK